MQRVNAWLLRSPWIFDAVRGVFSLLFGLALWFFFDQALTIGVLGLGVYLLADGVFDIAGWYHARQTGGRTFSALSRGRSVPLGAGALPQTPRRIGAIWSPAGQGPVTRRRAPWPVGAGDPLGATDRATPAHPVKAKP
jgi:hypothetical protein